MAKECKHIAARFGDHRAHGLRDAPPGHTPIMLFNEDGSVWLVVDLKDRIANAFMKLARKERVDPDLYLSAALVSQLQKFVDEQERGF